MSTIEIKNAKITDTMLGIEDHGILTCMVFLDYGGMGQGFGGYSLGSPRKVEQEPNIKDYNYTNIWLCKILEMAGVDKWEDLKGKYLRVKGDHSKITSIGHIIEDKWFTPSDYSSKVLDTIKNGDNLLFDDKEDEIQDEFQDDIPF